MRVWAFPWIYPYDRPGMKYSGIFAHRQYKGLVENGADLTVIIPVPWNPPYPLSQLHKEWQRYRELAFPFQRNYDGIMVYHPRISNIRPSRFIKKSYSERYADSIINFFKSKKIVLDPATDIFYSQWLPGAALVQVAAHKLGVRSAILSIGDDVVLWPNDNEEVRNLFIKTFTEADLRFACADYLGKESNRIAGKQLHYDVINWGVDYDIFKPITANEKRGLQKQYGFSSEKIIILNIGTAGKRKGWLDLFDALQIVKKTAKNFTLIGVATGTPEFDFNVEVIKRGLTENFQLLGEFAPDSLNKIYGLADIFCLPSHSEGMANVVMEAMSSGLPVITTNVGGHPELINGDNGILVPPQQPAILADKLLELINDEQLRHRLGANARQFIVEKWGNFADNVKVLYAKLCSPDSTQT